MSDLLAVYVDGETKTGKGAAGKAMAQALQDDGYKVYYDVAGDFFRRYTALIRRDLGLPDSDELPEGPKLEETAAKLYESGQVFQHDDELFGNLERAAIGESVSKVGELPIAQRAVVEWWGKTLEMARRSGTEVMVLDGRNPRAKVTEAQQTVPIVVKVALDLFMTCEAEVAGLRLLRLRGVTEPTPQELAAATQEVATRRQQDRTRPIHAFVVPAESIPYDLKTMPAKEVVAASWQKRGGAERPLPIKLDNSNLAIQDMLGAVSELALEAVKFADKN